MKKSYVFIIASLLAANLCLGQQPVEKRVYTAKPVNPHPPQLDGRLDEPVWQHAEWTGNFTQRDPVDGAPPTFPTKFKIVYDEDNLYVGVRAYDDEPDKIVRRVTRRDSFEGDWVEINLDSYFDHRSAFSFTINAAGVKGDEAVSNDGNNWDANWNPIWFAEVAVDDSGWVAEMRIPFSQLRYPDKEEHVWGMYLHRRLFRKEERSGWQYFSRNTPGWVSNFGELRGLKGIRSSRRVELLPYSVSSLRRFQEEAGNPFATGQNTKLSGGLDAKVGVSSNLTMDVTINPDFGQVEADPSELNLTAFETFFEEKRPFFIEGKDILDFRLMGGDGGFSNDRMFYSRRIGRSPHHYPDLDDNENEKVPESASIAAAVKLTGKTQSGLSIGVLDAVTDREEAEIDLFGQRRKEAVEPRTNFFVGRLQKDIRNGETAFGGIFTATNRNLSDAHLRFLNRAAYTGGLDFRHRWNNKTYYINARTSFSHIRGTKEAILEAQNAPQRYYQRPDADYVELDPNRTSLTGHGGYLTFGRGGNHTLRFELGGMWRSPGLELNDLGFLRQADRIMQYAWIGTRITKPAGLFRTFNANFNQWWGWHFGGETIFAGGNVNGGGQLKNYWYVWLGVGWEGRNLSTTALRGGPAMKFPAQWSQWYDIDTDGRKPVQFGFGGYNSWADEGDSRFNEFRFNLSFRPYNAMRFQMNPFININKDDLQYVTTIERDAGNRYLFGRIDQKTLGITFRIDYSVTPDLSIQYYGQPFVSAGEYNQFKRITSPRAENYADRFHTFGSTGSPTAANEISYNADDNTFQVDEDLNGATDYSFDKPDFNFRQFRSNLVVRWEYSPGSTAYLVWSQFRTGFQDNGDFSFRNDLRGLFDVYPDNVFLIKLSRWFSL